MRPFITIEKRAQEALDFYSSIFPSFSLISLNHHAEPHHENVSSFFNQRPGNND